MSEPTNDFDEMLRAAAREYNRPDETPRDRMWENIRAARARQTAVPVRPTVWKRFVLPAVAAALLVLGVAIGRIYERMTTKSAPTPNVATMTAPSDSEASVRRHVTKPTRDVAAASEQPSDSRQNPSAVPRTARPVSPAVRPATNLAFHLAVVEHLAGTEAMLTSFRDEAARGTVDAQITSWARNLLTTTRLLQTAAAQQDPTMKRLLDDLELVLVQIAQYSSTGPHRAEELELIQHSIERRGVIGKLRTTIPARLAPSGT
jgi:cytoskeletal protein RodZ